jgi:DNA-binding CsgD family transcriptional regulator
VLDDVADTPRVGEGRWLHFSAEARLLATQGDPRAALSALDRAEQQMQGVVNPAWRPWRTLRADVLALLGRHDEAVRLAEEELVLARRWGTPALVGKTLRVLGEVQGRGGLGSLREAVSLLARSPRRLEHARALVALANALMDQAVDTGGTPGEEARAALLEAHSLAEVCAADGVREQAAGLLRRLGAPVPDPGCAPLSLTTVERRIAGLVLEGANHTEIAQRLFVTPGTVATIVEAVTERLGTTSLDDLRAALVRT